MDENQRFCPVPFKNFRVSTTGDLSICSPTRQTIPIVGNIVRDGVEGAWNSDTAIKVRRSILDGSFRYCIKDQCPALQKNALPLVKNLKDPQSIEIARNDRTVIHEGPEELNLHYDITCNLKCPSCRTKIIGLKGADLQRVVRLKNILLESRLLDGAKSMILCGYGDPFASRPHLEFLRSVTSERFQNLRIKILTNGLLLTETMWNSFENAHDMIEEIAVSVDAATPETYSKNRGGSFSRLNENLNFIAKLRRDGAIKSFRLNFVVQQNNYREMKNFVLFGKMLRCDRILFQKLADAGNAGMQDFASRAIHEPDHPEFPDFMTCIQDPIFRDPVVDLYTLGGLAISLSPPKSAAWQSINPLRIWAFARRLTRAFG